MITPKSSNELVNGNWEGASSGWAPCTIMKEENPEELVNESWWGTSSGWGMCTIM